VLISQSTLDEAGGTVFVGETMEVTPKGVKRAIPIHRVAGIRGRRDLCLEAAPVPMTAPTCSLDARFTVLDGKNAGGAATAGRVVLLSRKGAEIASASIAPMHANVKLKLRASGPGAIVDEVYAKVTRHDPATGTFTVRFTSLPAEAEALLDAALSGPCA
jgi:adenylate cyclase